MGATTFHTSVSQKYHPELPVALAAARDQAQAELGSDGWTDDEDGEYDEGDAGYTGTILEKHGYLLFPADGRPLDLVSNGIVTEALEGMAEAQDIFLIAYPGVRAELVQAQLVYDDKHADAVVFAHSGNWNFCGWAND